MVKCKLSIIVLEIGSKIIRTPVVQDGNGKLKVARLTSSELDPVCHTLSENASKISADRAAAKTKNPKAVPIFRAARKR